MNAALAQLQEKQAALAEAQEKLREVSLIPVCSDGRFITIHLSPSNSSPLSLPLPPQFILVFSCRSIFAVGSEAALEASSDSVCVESSRLGKWASACTCFSIAPFLLPLSLLTSHETFTLLLSFSNVNKSQVWQSIWKGFSPLDESYPEPNN